MRSNIRTRDSGREGPKDMTSRAALQLKQHKKDFAVLAAENAEYAAIQNKLVNCLPRCLFA